MSNSSSVDVAIVGAGAAGLGAARSTREIGLEFVLLEAMDRIGGRAFTDTETFGVPWDKGCHWLHSADVNPMRELADVYGWRYRSEPVDYRLHLAGRWLTEAELQQIEQTLEHQFGLIRERGAAGEDRPIAEIVDLTGSDSLVFKNIVAAEWGFAVKDVSAADYAAYRDTDKNWPVHDGYGALVARHAQGIPVQLSTPVRRIDWSGERVNVETDKGTIDAAAVIVTASTSALAAGAIDFCPNLPIDKQEAFDAVPLGNANKVGFWLDSGLEEMPDHCGALAQLSADAAMSFQIKPFGWTMANGYLAGEAGRALEREGSTAMIEAGRSALVSMFGSDIRKHIVKTACSTWDHEPFIRGGYGAARPGYAHKRRDLATPVADKVFFAGEATSPDFFSTCHGAHATGLAAANHVARMLGKSRAAVSRAEGEV
jgi:monoamine oxidase